MKFLKCLVVTATLAAAAFLAPKADAAITIKIAGAGSSAVYQATLDAAITVSGGALCGTNHWTKKSAGTMHDNRTGDLGYTIPDEHANVWVTWDGAADGSTATVSCYYIAVDSGIGVRGYMANPRAGVSIIAGESGAAGDNLSILAGDVALPATIFALYSTTIPGVTMNICFSDVRPEDAQYQAARIMSTIQASRSGLGYGNFPNATTNPDIPVVCPGCYLLVGTPIQSSFKAGEQTTPVWFELTTLQHDSFSGNAIQGWETFPVGAVPILPIVSNQDISNTGLGSGLSASELGAGPWTAGPYAAANLDQFTAGWLYDGSLTRTVDVITNGETLVTNCTAASAPGGTGANDCALAQLQREPTSGTYTTFEYSAVRTHAVQNSQEDGIDPSQANNNPMNIQKANGSQRYRVQGTGEMVNAVCGPFAAPTCTSTGGATPIVNGGVIKQNRIGYAFWSYGNLKALRGNHNGGAGNIYNAGGAAPFGHYLTMSGLDGLFNVSTDNPDGALNPPICTTAPCPVIPFTHLVDGSYPVWNIVRAIVPSTISKGDGSPQDTLLSGLPAVAAKYSDFLGADKLHVFRSHRDANAVGISARNGNGCGPTYPLDYGADLGQDAGGAIFPIQSDLDYAFDVFGQHGTCSGINPPDQGINGQNQ